MPGMINIISAHILLNSLVELMSRALRFTALLLSTIMILPVLASPSSAEPVDNDLYITSIRPIQVVDDPRAIIMNKSTVLRLEVVNTFSYTVYSEFEITYDFGRESCVDRGPDGVGVPLVPGVNKVYVPGGNCTGHLSGWWTYPLTLMWTSLGTDSAVAVEVDPANLISESDETNNVKTIDEPIQVVYASPMRILVVPVKKPGESYEYDIDENIRMLRDLYPLADDGITVVEAPWETRSYSTKEQAKDITRSFSADTRALGYDRVIVVFKEIIEGYWELYGCAVGMLRDPEDRVPFLATAAGLEHSEDLLAHELGHTYYLWHPHDIGLQEYNATIWRCFYREYERRASTTMSYDWLLPPGVPSHVRWMDEQRYQSYAKSWIDLTDYPDCAVDGVWQWNLYEQFVTNPPIRIPSIVVSGMIYVNGSVLLNHTFHHIAAGVLDFPWAGGMQRPGNYSIRLLNAYQQVIGSYVFEASFTEMTHWDMTTEMSERHLDAVPFIFNIPDMPATRYVQVVNETDVVLAQRNVSEHAPTIQIASPNGGESISLGDICGITWTGEDEDGDPLTYMLTYSPDNGSSWVPIADSVTTSEYSWNTTGMRPGVDYLIKIIASDGYNTAEDVSASGLSISDDTPPTTTLSVEGIEGGHGWFVSDVNVTLAASDNYALNRSEYSYDGMAWIEYVDQFNLQDEGNTTIHYRSIDAAGNVENGRIAVVSIDKTRPDVQIQSIENGSIVRSEDLTVQWTSSDAVSGIAGHMIRLDGGSWSDTGLENRWNLTGLEKGIHTLEIAATDNAGNSNVSGVEFTYEEPSADGGVIVWIAIGLALIATAVLAVYLLYRRRT